MAAVSSASDRSPDGSASGGDFSNSDDENETLVKEEVGELEVASPPSSLKRGPRLSRFAHRMAADGGGRRKATGLASRRARPRQAHTLFDEAVGTAAAQYDVEAVKLGHERQAWTNQQEEEKRPSISSEESVSDYEVVGTLDTERESRREETRSSIWQEREIEAALRSLCFTVYKREDVYTSMEGEDQNKIILTLQGMAKAGKELGPMLLLATWQEKETVVAHLLKEGGVDPMVRDPDGRTALHLAAIRDNVALSSLLLQHKAVANVWDGAERATPLFCAAAAEDSRCLAVLLAAGADPNMGLHELGISALHCAASSNATNNMLLLLQRGAEPNSVVLFSETPLHIAASMGYAGAVRILLEHGAGTEMLMGSLKMSALHLAAREGNVECVSLLLSAGADPKSRNARGQSALHLAALAQSPETVELLLNKGANPDSEDLDRRTPLHSAIVKGSRSYECVRMLLDARANVNHQDSFGYSPLHIAALNEYSYCASLLLSYGADITSRTKGGTSALSMIVRKIPSVLPKFEDMLDEAITLAEHDINDVDCEIKLDYKVLIPNKSRGESGMFITFIETGHNHLLKHPLCESFLHLKWLKVRKFFMVSLSFHLVFTMLHTAFVLQVYSNQCILKDNCRYGNMSDFNAMEPLASWVSIKGDCFLPYLEKCRVTISTIVVWVLLIISTLVLSCKEIFQMMHSQKLYFCNWENWVQWGIIINVLTVSFHTNPLPHIDEYQELISRWQHHAAAVGVFLVWGELMLMVGRLPTFGIYVQMFTTVARNFFRFLAAYFCLLVAFALSFSVLFPNYQSFSAVAAVVKTLVMMAGEIEYEDFVYENGAALYPFTGHVMILLFVVLISIILMNLLVGLAVSDIQGLQKSAGLDRLVRQTELISHIESMLFTRLLHFLPRKFLDVLHQNALVVPHAYNWTFTIRPNDLREDRLSRDITESVHSLVARRHQSKKRRPFSRYTARAEKRQREKNGEEDEVGQAINNNNNNAYHNTGNNSRLEDQVKEIKITVKAIQTSSVSIKRNLDVLKANMLFLVSRNQHEGLHHKRGNNNATASEKTISQLADKIHKSLLRGIFPDQLTPVNNSNNNNNNNCKAAPSLSANTTATLSANTTTTLSSTAASRQLESESVRDLVTNLTHLALAITEDRQRTAAEYNDDIDDDEEEESAEENLTPPSTSQRQRTAAGSLERKLKRTNLMRRRESQALLDGLRKTRSSMSNTESNSYGGHHYLDLE